ncbi:NAD(P)-dependent oxidoreductase [Litorisediminicola beolgyonensis]|uniref:NAD(P)-dependent oxidoreductase n=1 Tax=Litorisediminicola beolgyonensis TaxID=1173614 RepID=A0ABW3ZE09_9RHOB
MAHILVIGASKGIGRAAVERGLELGHQVRAFSRGAAEMTLEHPALELCPGDATRPEDLEPALQGVDAVILCLGIKETPAMLWQKVTLFSDATAALLPLMEATGSKRLIAVTGIGAGDSRQALSSIERAGHWALLGRPYADKTRQEEMIRASGLDWTLARPVILTRGARTERYRVLREPSDWRMGLISRADVADFLMKAVDDASLIGQAPVLSR